MEQASRSLTCGARPTSIDSALSSLEAFQVSLRGQLLRFRQPCALCLRHLRMVSVLTLKRCTWSEHGAEGCRVLPNGPRL